MSVTFYLIYWHVLEYRRVYPVSSKWMHRSGVAHLISARVRLLLCEGGGGERDGRKMVSQSVDGWKPNVKKGFPVKYRRYIHFCGPQCGARVLGALEAKDQWLSSQATKRFSNLMAVHLKRKISSGSTVHTPKSERNDVRGN